MQQPLALLTKNATIFSEHEVFIDCRAIDSRAELVTLAPGLRPERRFAPLARG